MGRYWVSTKKKAYAEEFDYMKMDWLWKIGKLIKAKSLSFNTVVEG